ncbi:DUF2800 domain-containing protein [Acinetobacter sp. ANC 4639]
MTIHAKLSPSSAHRWMQCAGSLVLENGLPNTSSAHADEGTAAHFLASECLEQEKDATDFLHLAIHVIQGTAYWKSKDDEATVGFYPVDLEMAEYVQKYLDAVRSQADGNQLLVEQRVNFSEFIGAPDAFGTSDAIILSDDEIQVHDLKYGRGVKVDAQNNEQARLYALGALYEFSAFGDFKTVRTVIHQPRLNHVSEEVLTIEELYEFAHTAKARVSLINNVIEGLECGDGAAIEEFEGSLNPGEKQCHWCKAKATCPALTKHVVETITGDFDDLNVIDLEASVKEAIAEIPNHENDTLGKLFKASGLIKSWLDAVAAEVAQKLHSGEQVPGFKLVQGKQGNRAWANAEEAEQLLKSMRLKTEQMYDLKLISPTTAEKLQKAEVIGPRQWSKVEALITRAEGKPTVAPDSDKRPALDTSPTNDFETV